MDLAELGSKSRRQMETSDCIKYCKKLNQKRINSQVNKKKNRGTEIVAFKHVKSVKIILYFKQILTS